MKFTRETVTLLRDYHSYIRAIIFYDSHWYAIGPLGDPRVRPVEFSAGTKTEVKRWAKALFPTVATSLLQTETQTVENR